MLMLFFKGLMIGFAIAAPVGPIGILCIQRSLHDGFKIGFMTGIGAALADGVYGIIASFGLTTISSMLITYQFWIRVVGGLFLIYLGIKLFFKSPPKRLTAQSDASAWHACTTTFFLTLANPATILSFVAIFAGLGIGTMHPSYAQALTLVLSIVLGSTLWWSILSFGVAFVLHRKFKVAFMREINWLSGAIMLIFGMLALLTRNI